MKKYEYKRSPAVMDNLEEKLNHMGEQGWEAIHIIKLQEMYVIIFKRETIEEKK